MNQLKIAKYISIILGANLWLPVILLLLLFKTGLNSLQITILLPIFFVFQFLIPVTCVLLALKLKKISALDLPKRQERYPFLALYLLLLIISLILSYILGNSILFELILILVVLLVILSVITLFWKISLHASLNTIGIILINFFFNGQLLFLFLIIPIVAWARYKLKRHTILQLTAGTLVSMTVVLGGLKYFNLI